MIRRKRGLNSLKIAAYWPWVGVSAACLLTLLSYLMLAHAPLGQLRLLWLDQLFSVRHVVGANPEPATELIVIGVDEASIEEVARRVVEPVPKRWIIRYLIERLLAYSQQAGAAAIAVDFLMDVPVDTGLDGDIQDFLQDPHMPPVMLGALVTLRESKRPLEDFSAAQAGNLIALADQDGKYRRLMPGLLADAGKLPLFAFQACRMLRRQLQTPMHWVDGDMVSGPCRTPNEMLLDFIGPAQTLEMLGVQHSALDVLQERVAPGAFAGKLVLIGPSLRYEDRFTVSLGTQEGDPRYLQHQLDRMGLSRSDWPQAFEWRRSAAMSGLEIQANGIAQILEQRFLFDFYGHHPRWEWFITLLITAGLGWLFWTPFTKGAGFRAFVPGLAVRLVLFLAVGLAAVGISVWLFIAQGVVYVPLALLFAWVAQAFGGVLAMSWQVRGLNQRIEQMFGPAVGEDTLNYIKENPEFAASSRHCVTTILESDIRGFTPLTETLGANATVDLLREYYEYMSAPLVSHGGWIEKYVADSVMAAWNVLHPVQDHAYQAVCAAVGMKLALERFNAEYRKGREPVQNGIGINTGDVVIGNVGSSRRHNQTLIGDTANVAARVEGLARDGEVLMTESTYQLVRERVHAQLWGVVPLKGKTGSFNIYQLFGLMDGPMLPGLEMPEEDHSRVAH